MPVDLSLALTYGAIFLLNAFFHSSRVGLTPISRFLRVDAGGIVTIRPRESRNSSITATSSRRVVTPESRGSQSESLARNLINAILQHRVEVEDDTPAVREDGEDPAALPPPYPVEGMGVRGGRRGRRGQRGQG